MAELVSKRYAEALFEVALEQENLEKFKEEIIGVSDIFESEKELKIVFEHPKLSTDEKKDILDNLFKDRISEEVLNFLYIIVDKGREKYISDIKDEYIVLFNKEYGIVEGKAITAIEMTQEKLERLEKELSKKLNKTIKLENKVDSTVLGGVLVKIGDKVIDSSVKGTIDEMSRQLNNATVTKKEVEMK
ncbi:F0F1 ATP synthase subunit delta [Senegalia massiliensis]|uniref:F0F1 ATP synthase subunit delta n=1 Tax=Senegalia massiliensis TaxID=1720316 RepID=UPI001031F8FC|nr:F0F1 ATP synthase subunit delta [Senegalia massiliensis]